MTYWKGAGSAIGEGLGAFGQLFIQRMDQEAALRRQQEQQAIDNAYREQQTDLQRRQLDLTRDELNQRQTNTEYERDRQTRLDASAGRETTARTYSPSYTNFQQGVQADVERYAPTLKDGTRNPQFDRGMYEAALARQKQASKLWTRFTGAVGSGEGFEDARRTFLAYIGEGDDVAVPGQPVAAPGTSPAPAGLPSGPMFAPVTPMAPAVVPALSSPGVPMQAPNMSAPQQGSPTAPMQATTSTQAAPMQGSSTQGTPAQSAPPTLPANIQQLAPRDLLSLDDATIRQTYGQSGLEYARAVRVEYQQKADADRLRTQKAMVDFWTKAATNVLEDKDHPPTAAQLAAAGSVISYIQNPTKEGEQDFTNAIKLLAPQTMNTAGWLKVLESKDPNTIYAAYQMYRTQSPDVVEGFPGDMYYDLVQQGMDAEAADILAKAAGTRKTNTEADRIIELLPLEKREYDDKHDESLVGVANTVADTRYKTAQTAGVQATTKQTLQDVAGDKTEQAVKLLGVFSTFPPDMSYDQAARTSPALVSQLKSLLGVNDAGLINLWRQGQYSYGQGLRGKDLENQLRASEILTDGAKRGGIIATTADTQADTLLTQEQTVTERATRAGKVEKLDADIALAYAQGRNISSLVNERNTLLPYKSGQLEALTSQAKSGAALNWARIGEIQDDIQDRRTRTGAYVASVKGQLNVDLARVDAIKADTALTRATNPNDPLYNPLLAKANPTKPQNAVDSLVKTANVYYDQADRALKQAGVLQTQLNSLVKQYTGASGSVNMGKLQADPKYQGLVKQRDDLFQVAQNRTASGDKIITDNLEKAQRAMPGAASGTSGENPFKRITPLPGVTLSGVRPEMVTRLDTMLGNFTAPGGLIPVINQGVRTAEQQAALYAQGRTAPGKIVTNSKPGESMHETGRSVDISWKDPETGKVLAGNDPRAQAAWKALGSVAPKYGLRWGGTFKTADGKPFVDMYHFELVNVPANPVPTPQPTLSQLATPKFTANKGLETNLTRAFQTANRDQMDAVIGQMTKAGYTQAQIDAVIERAKK